MSKKPNETLIGLFVVGALILLVIAITVLGSGILFKQSHKYVLYFDGSVKGLSVGAPVMFRGVGVGVVKNISLNFDPKTKTVLVPVVVEIDQSLIQGPSGFAGPTSYQEMIDLGLKGKLEVQIFLTGQLMIALDFFPEIAPKFQKRSNQYPEIPTLPTTQDIFDMMNELPIKEISLNLRDMVKGINTLLYSSKIPETTNELRNTLYGVQQSARSFQLLTDYLERHPEAIIKGKLEDKGDQ